MNFFAVAVAVAAGSTALGGCGAVDISSKGSGGSGTFTGDTGGSGGGTAGRGGARSTGSGGISLDPGDAALASGGSAGTMVNPDAACLNQPTIAEQIPVALLFMLDNSGSMNTVDPGQNLSRWAIISAAIPAFVSDPLNAGIVAGLDFFPEPGMGGRGNNNVSCLVTDYENPNVPIDILPGVGNAHATAFGTAITGRMLGNGTPTLPALQGAIATAAAWQTAHPERQIFVVFVTDGIPNGCNSTVANAAMAAAAGLAGTPPIKTYVLGVGPEVVANLDPIAAAGGTGKAYVVVNGGAAALSAALEAIKGTALSCDYTIPRVDGGKLDFGAVNVQTRAGMNGTFVDVLSVADGNACGTGDGWYYDNPVPPGNPAPTKITLCPHTCDPLTATPGSALNVLIGCKTVPRGVN